jgi:chromosome segregation ATPase
MELAVLEEKFINLERRVKELEDDDKRINNKINEYNVNQALIMEQLSNINAKLDELAQKQEEILKSPKAAELINRNKAGLWDKITGTAISTIVGALIGALIALILK